MVDIPEPYKSDIQLAVEILQAVGCSEVYIFGSRASGSTSAGSDIDLAIRGCPKGRFFHIMGKLFLELEHPVDLVDLDSQVSLANYLEEMGELIQIA